MSGDAGLQPHAAHEPSFLGERGIAAIRYVCWILVACLTTYLVFIGGTYNGIQEPTLRLFTDAALAVVFSAWFLVAWRLRWWRPSTVLWPLIGAIIAAFGISTLLSWSPRISADYLAYATICAGLYLLLTRLLGHQFFRPRLMALIVVLASVVDIAYIAAVGYDWVRWWQLVGRVTAAPLRPAGESLTLGSPNIVATLAALLTAVAVAHLGAGTRTRTGIGLFLTLLAGVVVVLSGSRGAVLGLAVGAIACGLAWALGGASGRRRRGGLRAALSQKAVLGLAVALVAAIAALWRLAGPAIIDRVSIQGAEFRVSFVVAALRMFASSPLTGLGPGIFAVRRAAFTNQGEVDLPVPHAHDIYAQTIAEFGLVGVVAGVILVVLLLRLVRAGLNQTDAANRRLALAAVFGLAYLAGQQTVDFMVNLPAVMFAIAVPVACLDVAAARVRARPESSSAPGKPVGWLVAGAAMAAILSFLTWSDITALRAQSAVLSADAGDWPAVRAVAQDAVSMDPSMPPYRLVLGLALARAGQWQSAEMNLRQSVKADQAPEAWLDVAVARVHLGDHAGARDALGSALRLGSQRPAVLVAASVLSAQLGDSATAEAALTSAFIQVPSIASDPYWSTSPALASLARTSLSAAIAQAPPAVAWQVALYGGESVEAARLAADLPSGERALAQQVLEAWSGSATAFSALEEVARARPMDTETVSWCVAIATHRHDQQRLATYVAWIIDVTGGIGRQPSIYGSGDASQDYEFGAYLDRQGDAIYRRGWPRDILLPGLPLLSR